MGYRPARQPGGMVLMGPNWEGLCQAGGGEGRVRQRRRKYFSVVGDVRPYGVAYQGGTGG